VSSLKAAINADKKPDQDQSQDWSESELEDRLLATTSATGQPNLGRTANNSAAQFFRTSSPAGLNKNNTARNNLRVSQGSGLKKQQTES
jgi:hypothetical protein